MPEPRREHSKDVVADTAARIVNGPDPERFYCPHPGCNRSFAELWRLKVHFRAPPDIRGSGKERGHGTELKFCPKCGNELKPGKHHVGCSAGKSAPRQAAKRQRQVSTTTESEWATPSSTSADDHSDSWEETVRRQMSKVHQQQSTDAESVALATRGTSNAAARPKAGEIPCRVIQMQQKLTDGDSNAELVFTTNTMTDFGFILRRSGNDGEGAGLKTNPLAAPNQREHGTSFDNNPLNIPAISPPASLANVLGEGAAGVEAGVDEAASLLRVPSPPPLPPDWELGHIPGLLFDFDQFDASRRNMLAGMSEPVVTVTSAMNPSEMSNPSDDYIWQIMFAGENDPVPKRVTAHLHHPHHAEYELARAFDAPDPILDSIPWPGPPEGALHGANGKVGNGMKPPEPRVVGNDGPDSIPPLPVEALEGLAPDSEPQTITVTYVVQQGPLGKTQYTVQRVEPADAGGLAHK